MTEQKKNVHIGQENRVAVPMSLVRDLRSQISDYADTNELFEGEENSDAVLAKYLVQTLADFNGTPPIFTQPVDILALIVPSAAPLRSIVMIGATARILQKVSIKLARNDAPYTSNNVTIQRNAVWRNLIQIAQELKREFDARTRELKIAANVVGGWGGGGANALNAQLGIPSGSAFRSMLTEMYGGLLVDSVYAPM